MLFILSELQLSMPSQCHKTIPIARPFERQESTRIDVERAFEVLQSRFILIWDTSHVGHVNTTKEIMYTCIIIYNMIVEDEWHMFNNNFDYDHLDNNIIAAEVSNKPHPFLTYFKRRAYIHEEKNNHQLQANLRMFWELNLI